MVMEQPVAPLAGQSTRAPGRIRMRILELPGGGRGRILVLRRRDVEENPIFLWEWDRLGRRRREGTRYLVPRVAIFAIVACILLPFVARPPMTPIWFSCVVPGLLARMWMEARGYSRVEKLRTSGIGRELLVAGHHPYVLWVAARRALCPPRWIGLVWWGALVAVVLHAALSGETQLAIMIASAAAASLIATQLGYGNGGRSHRGLLIVPYAVPAIVQMGSNSFLRVALKIGAGAIVAGLAVAGAFAVDIPLGIMLLFASTIFLGAFVLLQLARAKGLGTGSDPTEAVRAYLTGEATVE